MSNAATMEAKKKALFARVSDSELLKSLAELDKRVKTAPSTEHTMVRAWTIDEVEKRFPAAAEAVAAVFEAAEAQLQEGGEYVEPDYVGILLAHARA